MNSEEYFSKLITEFPILKAKIENEDSEMIHWRMEIFSEYSIEQIETKNISELKRCFDFQESCIEKLNSELINALNVSYCESLLLGKCSIEMKELVKLMMPKLKETYIEYEKYYLNLAKIKPNAQQRFGAIGVLGKLQSWFCTWKSGL